MENASLYPVSGGSEAAETALKMVRAYWLAQGEPDRTIVVSRWGSYHGNTLGALDLSGRRGLRKPYEPWLGRFEHVSAAYPYRAGLEGADAIGSGAEAVAELDALLHRVGPGRIAAFVAEPIVGATLAAAVPPDDYGPAVSAWCERNKVLFVADEVMTGFGRTGTWFGVNHWGIRPDLLLAAKGATSGYWPFGFVAAAGRVAEPLISSGFVHGFTYSHSIPGAAVARAVLKILQEEELPCVWKLFLLAVRVCHSNLLILSMVGRVMTVLEGSDQGWHIGRDRLDPVLELGDGELGEFALGLARVDGPGLVLALRFGL
jgi:adenosylmethionine-8-amino-7-oxononanoate aminotransferase